MPSPLGRTVPAATLGRLDTRGLGCATRWRAFSVAPVRVGRASGHAELAGRHAHKQRAGNRMNAL